MSDAAKCLQAVLLARLIKETGWYLPESQAGFRKHRGTRDNVWILAELMRRLDERSQDKEVARYRYGK